MMPLAIIPSLILLIYIYKKDKREKEPMKLLIKCFIWGIIIIIPAVIMENILSAIFDTFLTEGSILYAFTEGFIVAAFSEELLKYAVLKSKTWKSPEFNCTFDGIIYSVFVSLGFATFENIMYIMDGGLSVAILRMFTSIPGHTSDAVFMGYYYSKAKEASLAGDKAAEKKYKRKALFIPLVLHGLYDSLISLNEESVGESLVLFSVFVWFVFIIVLYSFTFKLVNQASKFDTYFAAYDALTIIPSFVLKPQNWICNCKNINYGNFCTNCGGKRPDQT